MGKLDGLGGVKAPGDFRDGERKSFLWHPGIPASGSTLSCCLGSKEY